TEAETRLKWPSMTSKNASLAWVPPMSPANIIFRSSSNGARRARGVLQLPSGPRSQRHSSENFAEEAPSTHRGQNSQRTTRPRPCQRAGPALGRRSCTRGAGVRSRWRAVCRSSRRTRNSCPLHQGASPGRELWRQTARRSLPPAGCAARADWASDFRQACRGTERKARGGTESRYAYSALEDACRCAGKTEHRPNANCRLPASWQRRSRFLNFVGHRSLRDTLERVSRRRLRLRTGRGRFGQEHPPSCAAEWHAESLPAHRAQRRLETRPAAPS